MFSSGSAMIPLHSDEAGCVRGASRLLSQGPNAEDDVNHRMRGP